MQKQVSLWFRLVWPTHGIILPDCRTNVKIGQILSDCAVDAAQSAQAIIGQRYEVVRIKHLQCRLKTLDLDSLIASADYPKLATYLLKRLSNQQTVWPHSVRLQDPVLELLAHVYTEEVELPGVAAYNTRAAHSYIPNMIRSLRRLEGELAETQNALSRPDRSLSAPTKAYLLRKLKKLETHTRISNRKRRNIVKQIQDAVKHIVSRHNIRRWDRFSWNWTEIYDRFPFTDVNSRADLDQIYVWVRKISVKIITRNFKPKKFATARGKVL